jgi:hypothetical protein
MKTLAVHTTAEGLERNPVLRRKGSGKVGSICSSLFTFKYQVRNWKNIHKWISKNSITTKADLLIGTSFLDLGWNNLHTVRIL